MKDKIKEWLKDCKYAVTGDFTSSKALPDIIHDCLTDITPQWISVDDRLPKGEYAHVVVACEGGNIQKSFYCTDRNFLASSKKGTCYSRKNQGKNSGYFEISHSGGYKVTHWMPLPEPPK